MIGVNYVITVENKKVTASIYDRNIEVNQETKNLADKVRNSVVGREQKWDFLNWSGEL